ncbi:MAG: hypothetical protein SGPRY_011454, partial [Prymnesium sp.]
GNGIATRRGREAAEEFHMLFALEAAKGGGEQLLAQESESLLEAFRSAPAGSRMEAIRAKARQLNVEQQLPSRPASLPPDKMLLYDVQVFFPSHSRKPEVPSHSPKPEVPSHPPKPEVKCCGPTYYRRSLMLSRLGCENVVRVRFPVNNDDTDSAKEVNALVDGLEVAGRVFKMFSFKDDKDAHYFCVAVPGWCALYMRSTPKCHCPAPPRLLTRCNAQEARALFADFDNVPTVPKHAMRPALVNSQAMDGRELICRATQVTTVRLVSGIGGLRQLFQIQPPSEKVIQIVQVDDAVSAEESIMTDGSGYISSDLADLIPTNWSLEMHESRSQPPGGPLVIQMRLLCGGNLWKGTLMRSDRLACRTMVVRNSMLKVSARKDCPAASMRFWAFEVLRTSGRAQEARTSKQLLPLLEAAGGNPMKSALFELAKQYRDEIVKCAASPVTRQVFSRLLETDLLDIEACEREGREEPVVSMSQILLAGFELSTEPFLHAKVEQIFRSQLSKLELGKFPIPDSLFAYGVADPSDTLEPGTICVVQDGCNFITREAIIYRHPGLHPGSVRRIKMVMPSSDLNSHLKGVAKSRASAVIFSTQDVRSLAEELADGDLDGDEFAVIWNENVVEAFPPINQPAWSREEESRMLGSVEGSQSCSKLKPEAKEKAASWHMSRIRRNQVSIGSAANDWLMVSEKYGASHPRAVALSYQHSAALKSAKYGSSSVPSEERRIGEGHFPLHLMSHFPHRKERFTEPSDTILANLLKLREIPSMPECELPDLWHLVHPDFQHGGKRSNEMDDKLKKWESLYKKYRAVVHQKLVKNNSSWDHEKLSFLHRIQEEYREKFLADYTEKEQKDISPNSSIIAEAAAVYMVNCKHYHDKKQQNPNWRPVSLSFAWSVAGDYLLHAKVHTKPRKRRGAPLSCDVMVLSANRDHKPVKQPPTKKPLESASAIRASREVRDHTIRVEGQGNPWVKRRPSPLTRHQRELVTRWRRHLRAALVMGAQPELAPIESAAFNSWLGDCTREYVPAADSRRRLSR